MKRFFAGLNNYVVFFITVAFAVSCCANALTPKHTSAIESKSFFINT